MKSENKAISYLNATLCHYTTSHINWGFCYSDLLHVNSFVPLSQKHWIYRNSWFYCLCFLWVKIWCMLYKTYLTNFPFFSFFFFFQFRPLQARKILNLVPASNCRHAAGTHMLHMKCFHASQMAAAALQSGPASPHLACISSHILSLGMLLGYHAWLGAEKWGQWATALT